MARGFVAGFVKRDDRWIGRFVQVDDLHPRQRALELAKAELASQLGIYCGGDAVAGRKMVVVDALTPRGRELLERIFEAMSEA